MGNVCVYASICPLYVRVRVSVDLDTLYVSVRVSVD